jgi:hypothetical protein
MDGWSEAEGWNRLGVFSGGQCGRSSRADGMREDAFKFASRRTRELYREQFRFCKVRGFLFSDFQTGLQEPTLLHLALIWASGQSLRRFASWVEFRQPRIYNNILYAFSIEW